MFNKLLFLLVIPLTFLFGKETFSFYFKNDRPVVSKVVKTKKAKSFFSVYYSCKLKIPLLTAEYIYPKEWKHRKYRRPSTFKKDYYIESLCKKKGYKNSMADNGDYKHRGKDRGHQVPNGDFNFNRYLQLQTFLFSNVTPQEPSFNRYIWKGLENYVRYDIAKNRRFAIVYTGTIGKKGTIGRHKITVPQYLFKIVLFSPENYKIFLIENRKWKKKKYRIDYFKTGKHQITLKKLKELLTEYNSNLMIKTEN